MMHFHPIASIYANNIKATHRPAPAVLSLRHPTHQPVYLHHPPAKPFSSSSSATFLLAQFTNSTMGEAGATESYKDGRAEHTNSVMGEAGAKSYKDGRTKRTNSLTGEAGGKSYKKMVGNLQRQFQMVGNINKVLPAEGFRETNNV